MLTLDEDGNLAWAWAGDNPYVWNIYEAGVGTDDWVFYDYKLGDIREYDGPDNGVQYRLAGFTTAGDQVTDWSNVVVVDD